MSKQIFGQKWIILWKKNDVKKWWNKSVKIWFMMSYGVEIIEVKNRDEKRQLRVAYNSFFRKIFGYRWSESVTALQGFLGRPTWEELVEKRQSSFFSRIANHHMAKALSLRWLTRQYVDVVSFSLFLPSQYLLVSF